MILLPPNMYEILQSKIELANSMLLQMLPFNREVISEPTPHYFSFIWSLLILSTFSSQSSASHSSISFRLYASPKWSGCCSILLLNSADSILMTDKIELYWGLEPIYSFFSFWLALQNRLLISLRIKIFNSSGMTYGLSSLIFIKIETYYKSSVSPFSLLV